MALTLPDAPTTSANATKVGGSRSFRAAIAACAAVAVVGVGWPTVLQDTADAMTNAVFQALDWFYLASVTAMLGLSLWLALGRYGSLRLGGDDERPEFSTVSWLAMLFCAGMGAGLLFWGVAEPMTHFDRPPLGDPHTSQAARNAMVLANFHWGLHAWAIYCLAALAHAYIKLRRGTPYRPGAPIRAVFRGGWVAPVARAADFIAVLAVAFGVAGAMGLGALQIQTGLSLAVGVSSSAPTVTFSILAVLVVAYMASAATSLDKGIKFLSNLNMGLAIGVLLFVLVAGPTAQLLRGFVNAIGDYASGIVAISFRLYPYEALGDWMQSWTLTYLIWWIAWAPFVGVFIARISRGRTIREFVFGVLLAPTAFTILWFAVLGGTAFEIDAHGTGGIARLVREDVTVALFAVFDALPMSALLVGLSVFLVFVFVVTSVDSATYVLSMMTSAGSMDPPRVRKLTWGITVGVLTGALIVSSNVATVRAIAISGAIPFTFVLLLQIAALLRALRSERVASTEEPDS
ncbi:MAG: BCCT family transporter [Myxococcota bacterium]